MLKELSIENLAVISAATIPLSDHLNVFTGETGAGKSILIHGIQAVLGQRVSRDIVRTGCKKATVSALFAPVSADVEKILQDAGYEAEEDGLLLTREISSDGGSIGRINGKTAPVSLLRTLGEALVTIHGQHDNQILLRPERHLDVLDQFGEEQTLLTTYRTNFQALQAVARKLKEQKLLEQEKLTQLRTLQTTIAEISALDLQPDEDTLLETRFLAATHAERASELTNVVRQMLTDGEENLSDALVQADGWLRQLAEDVPDATPLVQRLQAVNIELRDISDELSAFADGQLSPAAFAALNDRRNAINTLMLRYHTDANGLLQTYADAVATVEQLETSAEQLQQLAADKQRLLHVVTELAKELHTHREHLAAQFAERVGAELRFLDMPHVTLSVRLTQGKLTPNGMDQAEFLISANPGEPPKSIAQIASGGELSRLMLALKAVIAQRDAIPTLIFDEIDTGVSGRAAQKIGFKLRALAEHRQILCVTHLAQLAVQAQHHLLIEKQSDGTQTHTQVTTLDDSERVQEIARIMGGANPSALLLQTAAEALSSATGALPAMNEKN